MDPFQVIFLISLVITAPKCSASFPISSETTELLCSEMDKDEYNLTEGEAFYFVPDELALESNNSKEETKWYKNNVSTELSTDENQNVHYHGAALYFSNLRTENSGLYIARNEEPSGKCYNFYLQIQVFKASYPLEEKLLYGEVDNSDVFKEISCPDPARLPCEKLGGHFSWEKYPIQPRLEDFTQHEDRQKAELQISKASAAYNGIYTCICTWKHKGKEHKTKASRKLTHLEPRFYRPLDFISPTNKEQLADEGFRINLSCSVHCGTNVGSSCSASWEIEGVPAQNQITKLENPSQETIATAILTIEKVSAADFNTEFKCIGRDFNTVNSTTLTLKRRESIIPLVIGGVCVFFVCVFAAMLVKHFSIDLALFFRPYFPLSSYKKDTRMYDAYVVYQMQSMDKDTEDTLCEFVTRIMPSVLEEKCGYRLFIHGRDDIPGEDRLELVEDCMKQSRRLMVILTPGSGAESDSTDRPPVSPQNTVMGGFDWQLGLHHVLVQREMSVILIQLGNTGPKGYTHLPPGLQHLIQKSAPIKWPVGSRGAAAWNSRFWKRVRYLMPATPAKKCLHPAII
ncbi:interleukin-1 receptor type 1 [Plectropomus leopardus]|uniref:interleukin-1 receptor type 1 n=1 Tax=Plectropomus leopardus TaxID=160734 RepID=UPI001C4D099E|nr:interleukin-1 receptor type 1 [Plectropomus leopardus]